MAQSINLDQLIAKSKQRQLDRMKLSKVYIEGYDAEFPLVSLGVTKITEMMEGVNSESVKENMEFNKELIYASMPILRNAELQAEHTCAEPFDIVLQVFTLNEMETIVEQIMAFNGMDVGVGEVKNSSGPTTIST